MSSSASRSFLHQSLRFWTKSKKVVGNQPDVGTLTASCVQGRPIMGGLLKNCVKMISPGSKIGWLDDGQIQTYNFILISMIYIYIYIYKFLGIPGCTWCHWLSTKLDVRISTVAGGNLPICRHSWRCWNPSRTGRFAWTNRTIAGPGGDVWCLFLDVFRNQWQHRTVYFPV